MKTAERTAQKCVMRKTHPWNIGNSWQQKDKKWYYPSAICLKFVGRQIKNNERETRARGSKGTVDWKARMENFRSRFQNSISALSRSASRFKGYGSHPVLGIDVCSGINEHPHAIGVKSASDQGRDSFLCLSYKWNDWQNNVVSSRWKTLSSKIMSIQKKTKFPWLKKKNTHMIISCEHKPAQEHSHLCNTDPSIHSGTHVPTHTSIN